MKISYWVVTALAAAMLLLSGFMHVTHNPQMVAAMRSLGYPEYMMTILGLAKICAAVALVIPRYGLVKEWAYAGSTFLLIGAIWSHLANGQSPAGAALVLVLLLASYTLRRQLRLAPLAAPAAHAAAA